ncbi:MAG: hypothetical protein COA73_06240 [Candidatus Hydrogenedentota bacterium]|nr:MAG: hypothetical protein COA73_06240 [Candidatus Hydrogenedentota bacterium]
MGLSFLAPLFFAGLGLLAAPFLIHQIRRPEREPMKFSSLLFIPDVPKEVIERRRVQHILLMLMRMALLLLLVFAFARPYWKAQASFSGADGPIMHLVMLDTSYSMGVGRTFDRAKSDALKIISDVALGEQVAVMTFGGSQTLAAPLATVADPNGGTIDSAREAINRASLTQERTIYLPALEAAQRHFTAAREFAGLENNRTVVHLISDYRKSGMPHRGSGWKLPANVELNTIVVSDDPWENFAVADSGIRKFPNGDLRIVAKVRNWSDQDVDDLTVTLQVNGQEIGENEVSVKAGSATQTSFRYIPENDGPIDGILSLEEDDLLVDNTRYFTWNPPRKSRVAIVTDDVGTNRWPSHRFFEQALPNSNDMPWTTETIQVDELDDIILHPARHPKIIIVSHLDGLTTKAARSLREYMEAGGHVLFTVNESVPPADLNRLLLADTGVEAQDWAYPQRRDTQFDVMSWINLDHPMFLVFNGTKYNDFSSLRFYNHLKLNVADEENSGATVLARFDNDNPALIEIAIDQGKLMLWPFAVQLDWTNLPKTARFVPLLHETLYALSGFSDGNTQREVGQRVIRDMIAVDESGNSTVRLPGQTANATVTLNDPTSIQRLRLDVAGFFRSRSQSGSNWTITEAVNVDASEGDDTIVSATEFELKMAAAPMLEANTKEAGVVGLNIDSFGNIIEREYGRNLLLIIFILVLVESVYMTLLSRRNPRNISTAGQGGNRE